MRRARAWTILIASIAACDGTTGPVLVPDAAIDAGPRDGGPPPPVDGGPPRDVVRPTIVATDPDDGATGVDPATAIAITFSEPMAEGGTITLTADGAPVAIGAPAWDGATVRVQPLAPLPSEARARVTIDTDLADRAGNRLALPRTITFDVADVRPPVVLSSDPPQGGTELGVRLDAIAIAFDEPMDAAAGAVRLEGGPGTLGAPAWRDPRTIAIPLSGLAYGRTYRAVLEGFADASGNALDASVYLAEGAITWTSGPDDDPPRVVDSIPTEGQVNVALRGTPDAVLVFDEPMDESAGVATLRALGTTAVLAGAWSEGGRRLTLPVAGRLYPSAPHAIELAGFRDLAGNALDAVALLGDGRLDFDTGADATVPVVVFSYPQEGSVDSDHHLARIEIAFDRAMDTSVGALRVDDGVAPFDAPLTWNLAGTRAYADVAGRIHAGREHSVDLRGLVDLAGDPVDPAAPYLGDGVLDFATRAPRGEQCRDELRISEATARTAAGGYEWVIAETSMLSVDEGPACRYEGAPHTAYSPDAVIVYRKTSAAGSSGGRYLHVSVDSPGVGHRATLAIYRDVCGRAEASAPEDRVSCQWNRWRWEQYLDVGAGDYYVWVASVDSAIQDELVVRVEELDAVPAGESCASPYTTSSPLHSPPAAPGGEHTWTVPSDAYQSPDMSDPDRGGATCDADGAQGTDFVIRFDKAEADTLVSVVAEGGDGGFTEITAAARSLCDPRGGGATLACETGIRPGSAERMGPRRMTYAAPAGPTYVWIANVHQSSQSLPATVRIQEFDRLGSSCADAIRIASTGTVPIAPSSPARLAAPSCFQPDNAIGDGRLADGITWYRLTAAEAATSIRADAAGTPADVGALAVIDAITGRELGCTDDASQLPLAAIVPAGSDVCVAVRNGSGVGQLEIRPIAYRGVRGVATDLAIERPLGATGSEVSITGETWLAATPTTLYLAIPTGLVVAPRSGGVRAELRALAAGYLGNAGLAIGESIFSLDDATTAGTGTRLWRLVDAAGAPDATAWDTGTSWPADAFDSLAYDGVALFVANDYAATVPVAVRRLDAAAPGAATALGSVHASMRDTLGMAADATWLFFAGVRQLTATTTERAIYRVRRSELGTAAPERIAPATFFTLAGRVAMAVDSTIAASVLYVRMGDGRVHAIVDPGGASPELVGPISPLGEPGDYGMAYDPSGPSIFLLETTTRATGSLARLE